MSSPCCGLLRNATALILADLNVAMMDDGQTNDPRDESRMGGNPFIRRQTSGEEDRGSVEWQLGNGPVRCSLLILWESNEEQSKDASFGSPSTQTSLRECHSSVFQTWSFSIREVQHGTFKGSRENRSNYTHPHSQQISQSMSYMLESAC